MFVILSGIFACVIKAAAWLFHRTSISWKQSLICSGVLHFVTYVAHDLATAMGFTLSRGQSAVLVLLLQFTLCMWFFARHATSINGQSLGISGGAKLSAVVLFLLFAALAVPQVIFKII
jgi:hypothetical protein